ncbi:MAG: ABC transporter permease [Candidatus Nanopelagicales bacterium]
MTINASAPDSNVGEVTYNARHTLTVPTEFIRQVRRKRTLIAFILVIALPIIVVAAVKFGPSGNGGGGFGDGDLDLVGLATFGAWNFTLTMLFFGSGFLFTILAAMFLGDTVASEASWSTMRYLLAAPVPRRRLLRAKIVVGLLLTFLVMVTLIVTSFIIGLIAFGSQNLNSPLSGTFTTAESLQRLAVISLYITITLLVPAGIAFLLSVSTDVPLGAVGGAVVIVIVANILDAIEALGDLRRLLPTDYGGSWIDALGSTIVWDDMAIGAAYNISVFAILIGVAIVKFDRKNILS